MLAVYNHMSDIYHKPKIGSVTLSCCAVSVSTQTIYWPHDTIDDPHALTLPVGVF